MKQKCFFKLVWRRRTQTLIPTGYLIICFVKIQVYPSVSMPSISSITTEWFYSKLQKRFGYFTKKYGLWIFTALLPSPCCMWTFLKQPTKWLITVVYYLSVNTNMLYLYIFVHMYMATDYVSHNRTIFKMYDV